jgi:ribosomal protein S18 acetylase RimI-like enzyme
MALGPLSVGLAHPEDAEALRALRRAVLAEGRWFATRADEHAESPPQARAAVEALLRQPNGTALVARRGPALVGMLAVHGERLARMQHLGRLEMMVAAEERGRGVGRALLGEALRWAEANPLLRKLSLAVFADNARAVALYEGHGFVREGRREGEYLLEDGSLRADLLMARWVG